MEQIKERLDVMLVKKGFFETREKAQKNIQAGFVYVDGKKICKCGEKLKADSKIEVKGEAIPYVSRGGLKLEKAINEFDIRLDNFITMDVGASTGGFTDCMLKNKAVKVFAVDVGNNQLAMELRADKRVVSMEKTNIRYVKTEDIGVKLDFLSIDVAFISLKLVFPAVKELLKKDGELVALIKPQFEAGREKLGKNGVVKEPGVHRGVIIDIVNFSETIGFEFLGLTYSPVKGPEGNIEYLLHLKNSDIQNPNKESVEQIIKNVVERSHNDLGKKL